MQSINQTSPDLKKIRHRVVRHARSVVLPSARNNYRPHLISRYGLSLVLVLVLAIQFVGHDGLARRVLGDKTEITTAQLLEQTNHERSEAGVGPLSINRQLNKAAELKAQDMLTNQYWDHTSPSGVEPWKWVGDANYRYIYAGENLARNFSSSEAVTSAWMSSPTHRENLLKPQYRDVGFAVVDGEMDGAPTVLIVAYYGMQAPSLAMSSVQGTQFMTTDNRDKLTPVARIGVSLKSMGPVAVMSLTLVLVTAIVALVTQMYRWKNLERKDGFLKSQKGLLKGLGLISLAVIIMILYGVGGQI